MMSFSLKQLFFCIAVLAFALVAMFSEFRPVLAQLFDLLTSGILVAAAYGAWLANGEKRAFRAGFFCWALALLLLFERKFDVGIFDLLNWVYRTIPPFNEMPPEWPPFSRPNYNIYDNFVPVCQDLLMLILGVVGGLVTVWSYRKRQDFVAQEP